MIADAVVDLLAARGLVAAGPGASAHVLGAWVVSRPQRAVRYMDPTGFGAIRMDTGPKARLGFELAAIESVSATTNSHP